MALLDAGTQANSLDKVSWCLWIKVAEPKQTSPLCSDDTLPFALYFHHRGPVLTMFAYYCILRGDTIAQNVAFCYIIHFICK